MFLNKLSADIYATDHYRAYTILPKARHIQSKAHTYTVESKNSQIRHYLARFRRRTKCYSKAIHMVIDSLTLLFNRHLLTKLSYSTNSGRGGYSLESINCHKTFTFLLAQFAILQGEGVSIGAVKRGFRPLSKKIPCATEPPAAERYSAKINEFFTDDRLISVKIDGVGDGAQ